MLPLQDESDPCFAFDIEPSIGNENINMLASTKT